MNEQAFAIVRVVALATVAMFSCGALSAQQTSEKGWVGKLVVPKSPQFNVEVDGKPLILRRLPVVYSVVAAKGSMLLLQREKFSGWTSQEQVVPVDRAVGFFTDYIRAQPRDVYGYSMRALVRTTSRGELDRALSDYNQAIQLDPTDAWLFVERGEVWLEKREFDKVFKPYRLPSQ